ncbi:MAG TPA: MmcQ/YjbR family DNA-binding protein [Candidatus Saccharimonadales bacterium]|nr:MmcQ/YjbR family DNA-binding protein [Candidatus Saccharimonadales bacterium]
MTMTHKEVETYILGKPKAALSYPFGKDVAVYKVGTTPDAKIFALIAEGSDPVRISLKCEPQLAEVLREKYESVMPGYHLNKKHWNTIVLTGQLEEPDILALIDLSYQLVTA